LIFQVKDHRHENMISVFAGFLCSLITVLKSNTCLAHI